MGKETYKIASIAIGYNRVDSYRRLVESLLASDYMGDEVDLILSIDNSDQNDVIDFANTVCWPHGKVRVNTFAERQGLRNHIIKCGDFLEEYDAVIVFEDDIVASPAYYRFAKQSIEQYFSDDNIAGISLYSHKQNVHARYPFTPHAGKYDVFFLQMAQSWGQVWLKKQWMDFKQWYYEHIAFEYTPELPQNIFRWGKNSWLKYHIRYCVENNKYFVYPYDSYATCFAEAGTHSKRQISVYQVAMNLDTGKQFKFPVFGDADAMYYDVFFERKNVADTVCGLKIDDVVLDLYGNKVGLEKSKRFIITRRRLPYKKVCSFGCMMHPHEDNIVFGVEGNVFSLYDTAETVEANAKEKNSVVAQFDYYTKNSLSVKEFIVMGIKKVIERMC